MKWRDLKKKKKKKTKTKTVSFTRHHQWTKPKDFGSSSNGLFSL